MGQLDREEIERIEKELREQAADLLRRGEALHQQGLALADEASRLRQQLGKASFV